MPTALRCRVAGVTFVAGYPNNLIDLVERTARERITVDLIRDHDNPADLNAVAVECEGRPLGHLPADFAAFIGPQLDAGVRWTAAVAYVPVDDEHRDRPGLELDLTREH